MNSYFILTKSHVYFREVFRKYDDLNTSIQETLTGVRVVKAYVREDYEIDKLKEVSTSVYKGFVSAERILLLNTPSVQFTIYTCNLLIL